MACLKRQCKGYQLDQRQSDLLKFRNCIPKQICIDFYVNSICEITRVKEIGVAWNTIMAELDNAMHLKNASITYLESHING